MYLKHHHTSGYKPPSGCNLLFCKSKPIGWHLVFNHTGGYTPPSGCSVIFNSGSSGKTGQETLIATPLGASVWGIGTHILWQDYNKHDRQTRGKWRQVKRVERCFNFASKSCRKKVEKTHRATWDNPKRKIEVCHRAGWGEYEQKLGRENTFAWRNKKKRERQYNFAWGEYASYDREKQSWWIAAPTKKEKSYSFFWGEYLNYDRRHIHPWGNPLPKEIHHRTAWGRDWYERICLQEYEVPAGDQLVFYHDSGYGKPSGCNLILRTDSYTYDVRCKQREPSGWRDNYFYDHRKRKWTSPPKLKVYITVNSALLHRLSDNKPIEAFSLELKADIDSWCWGFAAKVSKVGLDTMLPGGEPCEIEIVINGYRWVVLVEDWQESRGFSVGAEYSVTGRSSTAMLSERYAPKRDGSNDYEATAQQLAVAQLENTGFALDWQIEDWLIATGALSYNMATPIKVIQQIAEAAGARVISHRSEKQLIVVSRLHSKPWAWAGKTPDIAVSNYVVKKIAGDTMSSPLVNAVFVSGGSAGITSKVVREGTAGEILAPMITNPLITATEAARQRGLAVIGRSGKWRKEKLEMRLFADMAPRLAEIGQLLVMEDVSAVWFGQVAGITITCDLQPEFEVTQYLDVERYYGK